jgi:hypothetical protein
MAQFVSKGTVHVCISSTNATTKKIVDTITAQKDKQANATYKKKKDEI